LIDLLIECTYSSRRTVTTAAHCKIINSALGAIMQK